MIWAIPFWKRFIDDIFLIFIGTTKQLQSMKDFMNNLHPTIKFTFEHSTQEISFLDMKIHIRTDHKLSTTLYRKPTDCAALLHFHSNHSLKCKESPVFSQALRYNLTTKRTWFSYNISPCQKIPSRSHHSQYLQSPPPLSRYSSLQNPEGIKFHICPPSRNSILIRRKTILQVSSRPLAYHWEWSRAK